jgi:hypothetical protein
MSISGGVFTSDGRLICTGHDNPELYVLRFPTGGSALEREAITRPQFPARPSPSTRVTDRSSTASTAGTRNHRREVARLRKYSLKETRLIPMNRVWRASQDTRPRPSDRMILRMPGIGPDVSRYRMYLGHGVAGLCYAAATGLSYIQMHVDPNATVAGYPVLLVRQALRKLRQIDTWSSGLLEAAAGLPVGAGRERSKNKARPCDPDLARGNVMSSAAEFSILGSRRRASRFPSPASCAIWLLRTLTAANSAVTYSAVTRMRNVITVQASSI